ncbi:MAG: FHA domain-containing protein [Pirellulaceae bacterium]
MSQDSRSLVNRSSTIPLDRLPAIIGREPECDVRLRDPWVSGLHCEIDEINGGLKILDLESRHGTFVNGYRVRFAPLAPGDTLRLGQTRLVVAEGGRALRMRPSRECFHVREGTISCVPPSTTSEGE